MVQIPKPHWVIVRFAVQNMANMRSDFPCSCSSWSTQQFKKQKSSNLLEDISWNIGYCKQGFHSWAKMSPTITPVLSHQLSTPRWSRYADREAEEFEWVPFTPLGCSNCIQMKCFSMAINGSQQGRTAIRRDAHHSLGLSSSVCESAIPTWMSARWNEDGERRRAGDLGSQSDTWQKPGTSGTALRFATYGKWIWKESVVLRVLSWANAENARAFSVTRQEHARLYRDGWNRLLHS